MADPILGEFEQLILLALVRQGAAAYGVSVCQELVDRTGRDVSLAAVYKTLERLEAKGLIAGTVGEPTAERGGRRKKHFRVLAPGQRALKTSLSAIHSMTEGLGPEFDVRLGRR